MPCQSCTACVTSCDTELNRLTSVVQVLTERSEVLWRGFCSVHQENVVCDAARVCTAYAGMQLCIMCNVFVLFVIWCM